MNNNIISIIKITTNVHKEPTNNIDRYIPRETINK